MLDPNKIAMYDFETPEGRVDFAIDHVYGVLEPHTDHVGNIDLKAAMPELEGAFDVLLAESPNSIIAPDHVELVLTSAQSLIQTAADIKRGLAPRVRHEDIFGHGEDFLSA